MMATMATPEMVRVRNVHDRPFTDGFAGQRYALKPGDTVMVPWAAATLWFGDPYILDKPTIERYDRRDEVERLYTRMGCYDGDGASREQRFTQYRPKIEVETLDGENITMLVDDLDGSSSDVQPSQAVDERTALASELERMKQVQAELLQRLHTLEAGQESFDELPTDLPTKIPVDEESR